jgi:dTDP-glucose pyrophosphorylase
VDSKNKLQGTVTDGDIRRGLINGLGFGGKIKDVMYRNYRFIPQNESDISEKARYIMLEQKIEQIPVLDGNKTIIDVILWTDIFGRRESAQQRQFFLTPVVIMAGGKGTRLDPLTKILPKPLIPVNERPIIEVIMEKFYRYGFNNFIFTLNYKKEYIKMFLKENEFPYNLNWVEENKYMGTAGGLSLLKDKVNETFFVSNCDIILNADYADILRWHKKHSNIMTLIGCHKEVKIPYGVLEMRDGVLRNFIEKPDYDVIVNTGVYVMEPKILNMIPEDSHMDMNILIENVSRKGKVSVYPVHGGWFDIGQWDEYLKNIKELKNT